MTARALRLVSERDDPAEGGNILRPDCMAEFIGQQAIKEQLAVCLDAARTRDEPLDHVLFYGPPGLGKTTLAGIIAEEMGTRMTTTAGPAIKVPNDLAIHLSRLRRGDVLFVDEIHRLKAQSEEMLYPAMEDYVVDFGATAPGQPPTRAPIKPFTLVGATTRMGSLTAPLRDRFGIILKLEFYDEADLCEIVERSGVVLNLRIDPGSAEEIARRSRGTPRIANRFLKRIRDYAETRAGGVVSHDLTVQVLADLGVDAGGLDAVDRKILEVLAVTFRGKPVGLNTLSAATAEDEDTIMDAYEPYLIQRGLLMRTPRGRTATAATYEHLGLEVPPHLANVAPMVGVSGR